MPFPAVPTPIQCPFCRAQITVPLRQIVDVTEEPQLKSVVLSGRLNAFVCPSCHNRAALATPFLYHDANKELALVFLPMEMGLKDFDQQRIIGQFTKAIMNKLPAEKRKAYLIQPKHFITMQSLLDAILEADGITKEMLAAQEAKLQLLQQMLETTDPVAQRKLIQEHDADVDSAFFQMISAALISTQNERVPQEFQVLMTLRNNLMELTTVGKRVKTQQAALEAFQAKPDRDTLLDQLVQAQETETRELLLTFGRPMLDYPFFQALTARVEAASKAGNKAEAGRLVELRREIMGLRDKLDAATKAALDQRAGLLRELLTAENLDEAVRARLEEMDDVFLGILDSNIQAAEQANQQATLDRLQAVADAISRAMAATQPPEIRFLNALLSVQYPEGTRQVLEANRRALNPQLIEWMRGVAEDLKQNGRQDAADQLVKVIAQAQELATEAAPAASPAPASGSTIVTPSSAAAPQPSQQKPKILIAKR